MHLQTFYKLVCILSVYKLVSSTNSLDLCFSCWPADFHFGSYCPVLETIFLKLLFNNDDVTNNIFVQLFCETHSMKHSLWNAFCETHFVKRILWNAFCETHSVLETVFSQHRTLLFKWQILRKEKRTIGSLKCYKSAIWIVFSRF